jgi:hypothetical protein
MHTLAPNSVLDVSHPKSDHFILLSAFILVNIALLSIFDHPFHILAFLFSILIAYVFKYCFGGGIQNFIPYFLQGYLIGCAVGSLFCLFWFVRNGSVDPDGAFKDYAAYMRYSVIPVADYFKAPKFNTPSFYLVNRFINVSGMLAGKDTYLLHLQTLFCVGGLVRCYILIFIKQVLGKEPGMLIRRFLLAYPTILLYSSGVLIRDQLIALLVTVAVVNYADFILNKRNKILPIVRICLALILLYYFRVDEPAVLLAIFFMSKLAYTFMSEKRIGRKIVLSILLLGILAGSQSYLSNISTSFEGKQSKMQGRIDKNAANLSQNVSSNSLGTQLLQSRNPIKYVLLPGYNLLIYFPFFNGWVVDNEIQIMSVVGGSGGLVWQLLLGMWIVGLKQHWQRRSQIDFLCLTGLFVFVVSIALIVPDMRYTYPGVSFMLGTVALGKEIKSEIKRRWPFVILCLYILYLFLKGF